MELFRNLRKRRFEKRHTVDLKDTYVITTSIKPIEERIANKESISFNYKKYYICTKVKDKYQHIRSDREIKVGLKEKYYEIIDFKNIEELSNYIENDELLEIKEKNLPITVEEILELEDVLNLFANR